LVSTIYVISNYHIVMVIVSPADTSNSNWAEHLMWVISPQCSNFELSLLSYTESAKHVKRRQDQFIWLLGVTQEEAPTMYAWNATFTMFIFQLPGRLSISGRIGGCYREDKYMALSVTQILMNLFGFHNRYYFKPSYSQGFCISCSYIIFQ
jgi:hypothetical protein